jgi:hypothetical protein
MRTWARLRWQTPEWAAFALTFGVVLLPSLLNGFPFLFPDSWGYSGACPDEMRSPVIGCAMRPFTWIAGHWAYALVQCAVTAFAVVLLWSRALKRRAAAALGVALLLSGVGLFAGWVMADVWTLTGLMALFVVLVEFHPAAAVLTAFAWAAHFGNFPVLAAAGALMLPWVRDRVRCGLRLGLCLAGAVLLVFAANLFGGTLKFSSGNGFVFLAARMLHDVPEVLDLKCAESPGFLLCARRAEVRRWSAENHQSFTWAGAEQLGLSWPDYNRTCRELVVDSVRTLPRLFPEHAAALARDTARLMLRPELSNGFETFGPDSFVAEDLRIAFPDDVRPYLASAQARGGLERTLTRLDLPFMALVWLSTAVCLAAVVAGRRRLRADPLLLLALFALVALAVNALVMSGLSGVFGRYQARLEFLLFLPAAALLQSRWEGRGRRPPS